MGKSIRPDHLMEQAGKKEESNAWDQVREKIKEANADITDEDLKFESGNKEEIYTRLAQKLHKTSQEVKEWIESISQNKTIAG